MADYYPMMVSLKGKRCVVFGGGAIATRKVKGLVESGADRVEIVSPDLSHELQQMVRIGAIVHRQREYKEEDLAEAFLIFAATDNYKVNQSIAMAAERSGLLCNAAHKAEEGTFVTPAVVRRGELLLAVATGGASPLLAARIKRDLEARYGEELVHDTARLKLLRERVQSEEPDEKRRQLILKLAVEDLFSNSSEVRSTVECLVSIDAEIGNWLRALQQKADRGHEK
ncbi:precorrin-2 dehydrogenase/sirohydrochlorin ferrochelatase family protein [Paenibacillus nasutitermitis]|uniref:precorrin-2 dehydrogenase n=1 Tax=Paenibacillus nasutitermitis TaxID=1652958 RepID=A0A916YP12_9BACL|nr:bifunctional precorrin-2 dehydrogenase/sirohydrochlorin ferrochelatase [Paenibacillus nasutitermitis]GGD54499.1 precorrin-2 dehydrogenase [Paenibacillus nasutitermitis]